MAKKRNARRKNARRTKAAGRRRRSARRRRNPWSPGKTIVAVIGTVVVLGGAAVIWKMKEKLAAALPEASETINYNYVPHLESWPHIERYPNEHAFGIQLQEWGYEPGPIHTNAEWTIIDAAPIAAVSEFQRDFNVVSKMMLPQALNAPGIVEDGLVGPTTANAFWQAEQWAQAMDATWPDLVALAWEEMEIAS